MTELATDMEFPPELRDLLRRSQQSHADTVGDWATGMMTWEELVVQRRKVNLGVTKAILEHTARAVIRQLILEAVQEWLDADPA